MSDYKCQLDQLLSEDLEAATERTKHAFARAWNSSTPLVLYGAGAVGRRAAKILIEQNTPPTCFSDGNQLLWGTCIDGLPVISPVEAVTRFGEDSVFLVTVFNYHLHSNFKEISNILTKAGVKNILPYPYVAWQYPNALLPHFAQGRPADVLPFSEQIRQAFTLFHTPRDQEVFVEMARVSLAADYINFTAPDPTPTYFPAYITSNMEYPVHLADCGAYDGDTLQNFLKNVGPEKLGSWHAFEPDPDTFQKLKAYIATLPADIQTKIIFHHAATGDASGKVAFSAEGTASSKIMTHSPGPAKVEVNCVTLDEIFQEQPCNFIKLDVEGYEMETLRGASNILSKKSPVIAASVYHKPRDFFEIPLFLAQYPSLDKSKANTFLMRRYMAYFYECVCYRY